MNYLMEWYDPELEPRADESQAAIEMSERERLTKLLQVSLTALGIPRRIGTGVSSEELSDDKRRCKRVAHVATQCVKDWGGALSTNEDVAREAAQVQWPAWWAAHQTWLSNRLVYIVTWHLKTGGDDRWTKSAVVRLNNEMKWLEYAMR